MIEGELTGKDEESKNIDKNSNIKDNKVIEIQIDIKGNDKNSLQDVDTEKLLFLYSLYLFNFITINFIKINIYKNVQQYKFKICLFINSYIF